MALDFLPNRRGDTAGFYKRRRFGVMDGRSRLSPGGVCT